jgi:hypothetical protein
VQRFLCTGFSAKFRVIPEKARRQECRTGQEQVTDVHHRPSDGGGRAVVFEFRVAAVVAVVLEDLHRVALAGEPDRQVAVRLVGMDGEGPLNPQAADGVRERTAHDRRW